MSALALDPGVGATAFAYWEDVTNGFAPDSAGEIKAGTGSWLTRCQRLVGRLEAVVTELHPTHMVVEYPAYFQSPGGQLTASSGDLVKLAVLTGMLLEVGRVAGCTCVLVEVRQWKGQLPKDVTQKRLERVVGEHPEWSHHIYDAVGIGLYHLGCRL